MKKIFAFILASIMVLSLVPASAFAAVTKCPKTHTVAVCDSLGISYSQIGNPVAATCLKAGYTVYECDKCGEQFLGNFTDKAEHNYQPDPQLAHLNVKADCTKGDASGNGISYVYCTVCEESYTLVVEWNHKDDHKLSLVAGSGIGCVARYKCSACGEEGYLNKDGYLVEAAAHDWEFDSVKAEPAIVDGVCVNGLATYKCSICKDIKDVEILSECKHYNLASNLVMTASEPTCDENGSIAVFQCPDCYIFFEYTDTGLVDLVDYNKDGIVDISDAIVPALGHVYDEAKGVKDGCKVTYVCEECELPFTKDSHSEYSVPYGEAVGMDSCISKLYTPYLCVDCATVWVKEEGGEDLGHETVNYTKASNCNELGYNGKYCLDCAEYTAAQIIADRLVEGYDYVAVVEDPDGANLTHYYRVVARTPIAKNPNAHRLGIWENGVWTDQEDLYIPCNKSGTVRMLTCRYCVDFGYELWSQSAASHKTNIVLGTINHYNDNENFKVKIPSYSFEYKGIIYETSATNFTIAKKKSATIYFCEECGTTFKKDTTQGKINTTTFFADKATAMKEYGYFEMAILPYGDYDFTIEEGKYVDVKKLRDSSNPAIKWDTPVPAANCAAKGYVAFHAFEEKTDYTKTRYAYLSSNNHTLATNAKWVAGEAPTCDEAGSWGYYVCAKCNAKFAFVGGANDDAPWELRGKYEYTEGVRNAQVELTSLVINKHVATLETAVTNECGTVTYWYCTECNKTFADENASAAFDPSSVHVWIYAKGYEGKAATCKQDGTLQIRTCANCDKIEFNALYEVSGEEVSYRVWTGNLARVHQLYRGNIDLANTWVVKPVLKFYVSADGKTATDLSVTKTCGVIPMYEHTAPYNGFTIKVVDGNSYVLVPTALGTNLTITDDEEWDPNMIDHTAPQYNKQICLACYAETLVDYVPATGGHINANGDILTTACDNASIKDRYCVLCDADIDVQHVASEVVTVEATCIAAGYTYWYCLTDGCGERVVEANNDGEFAINPDAHEFVATVDIEANYAHDGQRFVECVLCGESGDPETTPAPKVAGVEISLFTEFDSYMPGSIVNVTVSLESLRGVDVWAARFGVKYDNEVYQFIGYSNVADEFASAYSVFKANPIIRNDYSKTPTVAEQIEHGYVSIIAQAEEDLYIKGSYDLVTLQFKVIATEIITEDNPLAQVYGVTDSSFTVSAETVEYKTYKTWNTLQNSAVYDTVVVNYPIEVVNSKAKKVQTMFGDGENSVAPALQIYLDLDGDSAITLADAKYIYAMIIDTDAEYNVLADADGDGYVTPADLAILYDIFTGATTLKEVLFPEEESDNGEKLNQLGARKITTDPSTGKIIYDSYCDFNMNGIIDSNLASEMAALTGAIDYRQMWASMGYDVSNLY